MDSSAPPPILIPSAPATSQRPWYHWRRFGLNFLTISLAAHLLFGVGATYLIVQNIQAKRQQTFAGPPSSPNSPTRTIEHKVQMQKKQQTMSAPAPVKRITSTSNTKVALPAMPAMPKLDSQVVPVSMAGMGGTGLGIALGGGGSGGGNGGSGAASLFGFRGTSGSGLEGTFYDYKMDQGYQRLKPFDNKVFGEMVRAMLPVSGPWHPEQPYKHFLSPVKLHAHYFIFPAIEDTGAGAAFQSPRSGPGHWLAVYRGAFSSSNSGSFRFVGFGDNAMIVQVAGHIVLDASDNGYTGQKRESLGNIKFPKKGATPLFAGEWFTVGSEPRDIAIAVGDEGGIFCSGLFIQPRSMNYAQGEDGIPKLPVFMLGAATDADKQLLGKSLPPVCLQGPFFQAVTPRAADNGIFSR